MIELYILGFMILGFAFSYWGYIHHDNLINHQLDITDKLLQKLTIKDDESLYSDEGQKTLFNYTDEEE